MTLEQNYAIKDFRQAVEHERSRQVDLGYDWEHDEKHGIEHLLYWSQRYLERQTPDGLIKGYALIQAARDMIARAHTHHWNPMQVAVETFMKACGQDAPESPRLVEDVVADLRKLLIEEEWNGKDELRASIDAGDLVGIADGLGDLLYVVFGTAVAYGINIQEIFDLIHENNMTKVVYVGGKATVIRNDAGKILKPEGFKPVNLVPTLLLQGARFPRPKKDDEEGIPQVILDGLPKNDNWVV